MEAIHKDLQKNQARMKEIIGMNSDIELQSISLYKGTLHACIYFVTGLTDMKTVMQEIITPLQQDPGLLDQDVFKHLSELMVPVKNKKLPSFDKVRAELFTGSAILFIDHYDTAISFHLINVDSRQIEEPSSEVVEKGPRIGFVENITKNTTVIRQRANDPNLVIHEIEVGERNKKKCAVVFVEDIADKELVQETISRVKKIKIDDLQSTSFVEQIVEDKIYSIYPQSQSTERPDRVIGSILEGRVAVLLDGSPYAAIFPITLNNLLQSPDDYNHRWIPGSFIRTLRYICTFLSCYMPALYISLISFHPGLMPLKIAIAMAESRQNVPFPPLAEAVFMIFTIELLQESGLRLPRPVGQTIGLVGGVIIGQAAVQANIVSSLMVIVVSITALSSYTSPNYEFAFSLRIIRIGAVFCAATFGLFGLLMSFFITYGHAMQVTSMGYPFHTPFFSLSWKDMKDTTILRAPLSKMKTRPKVYGAKDTKRQE